MNRNYENVFIKKNGRFIVPIRTSSFFDPNVNSDRYKIIIDTKDLLDGHEDEVNFAFFLLEQGLYHFMADDLTKIYAANRNIKNLVVICIVSEMFDDNILGMLKSFMEFNNIPAHYFKMEDYKNNKTGILVNNPIDLRLASRGPIRFYEYLKYVMHWAKETGRVLNDPKKSKHVYLSRRLVAERPFYHANPGQTLTILDRTSDKRIDNEELVEDYFKAMGFDIVYPEEISNAQDQMSLMGGARVLISATSSGLANMMFMESGATIIELSLAFIDTQVANETFEVTHLHDLYYQLSYACKHTYVSINNSTTRAEDIISLIESNKPLKTFIEGLVSND